MPKSAGIASRFSWKCALAAGALCAAEVEGQERAPQSAGATVQASVTILPSLDAASFRSTQGDVMRVGRRGALLVTTARANEATIARAPVDPPVAQSFERLGRGGVRHTIAVLY
jgi:hypothetical protein